MIRTAQARHGILTDRERKNLAILDVIRRQGPIGRAEISRITELNIVTVSSYVDEYIEQGLVVETGLDVSSGGRRPTLVDFGPHAGYTLGIGVTSGHLIALVISLKGQVVAELRQDRPAQTSPALIDKILALTEEAIKRSKVEHKLIKGIGLGMPGIVDEERRTVRWPQGLGQPDVMVDVSLRQLFEQKFKLPFLVNNDADSAVFGEHWFELPPDVKDMIYMYSGVACGFTVNGQIYAGSAGFAGELGIANPEETDPRAFLEASYGLGRWSMELGMLERAREAMRSAKASSKIFELAEREPTRVTWNVIVKALNANDPLAAQLVRDAGVALGKKIAFLVNLLNPEIVIVGGGLEALGSVLLDSVKRTVKQWAIEEATDGLTLTYSSLGERAVALGAAALMTQAIFIRS